MASPEPTILSYKNDAYGKPMTAHVFLPENSAALVFHLGGFIVGSAGTVLDAQIRYMLEAGFAVVVPNYRLVPQVTGAQIFEDCEDAYEWAVGALPAIIQHSVGRTLDPSKVVAFGHSSGGTMALHLASCKSAIKAITAFYPSLFLSDTATSAHQPTTGPPFGAMPDYEPGFQDLVTISPEDHQVSEAPLAAPGTPAHPRSRWQMQLIKSGQWMSTVQPDGNFASIDPLTRLTRDWPPVMIVQGEVDNVPGSSVELAQRAEKEMKDAGIEKVALEIVPGQGHFFDLPFGASNVGDPRWAAIVKGLDWLKEHHGAAKRPLRRAPQVPQLDVHIRYV